MPAAFSDSVNADGDVLVGRAITLHTINYNNEDSAVRFLQFFDVDDTADVTLGTDTPDLVVAIGQQTTTVDLVFGMWFQVGCTVYATTEPTGSTSVTADAFVSVTFD